MGGIYAMKIICNIATKGDRPNELRKTVKSLIHQVDVLNIYDNSKNKMDYTDNAKFFYLRFQDEPCYYLMADDDIIYPDDYVETLIEKIEYYGSIVTFHGRVLKQHVNSYYSGHDVYDFRQHCPQSMIVDVGGTGVMGFRTDWFKPEEIYKSEYHCMSDLVLSLEAKKQGKPIICASHMNHWLVQQVVNDGIVKNQLRGTQENQIKLMKQILEL